MCYITRGAEHRQRGTLKGNAASECRELSEVSTSKFPISPSDSPGEAGEGALPHSPSSLPDQSLQQAGMAQQSSPTAVQPRCEPGNSPAPAQERLLLTWGGAGDPHWGSENKTEPKLL